MRCTVHATFVAVLSLAATLAFADSVYNRDPPETEIRERLTSGAARICRVRHASLVAGARIRPDAQLVAERAAAQREDLRYSAGGRLLCLTGLVREL